MKCTYCERACDLSENQLGFCKMYHVYNGKIQERFPHQWSMTSVSRIESVPFYHVYPGSKSLVIGTISCNFRCRYCSNGFVACQDPEAIHKQTVHLSPAELLRLAQKTGCHNIIFNVNEPAVSLPTLLEVGKLAREAGIPMGCLTNAYTTEISTELLASIFQFINIGLKGFSSEFYRTYIGVKSIDPILRNLKILANKRHVEVTTPVLQDINDHELNDMADFLSNIDKEIPWHVFRLLPEHEMKMSQYPSIDKINDALAYAREKLSYVYFHNFVGSEWVNTICPECGRDVIERFSLGCGGDRLDQFNCIGHQCPDCGYPIKLLGGKISWNLRKVA
jgi:pyruvate formate lyase activating enzyme